MGTLIPALMTLRNNQSINRSVCDILEHILINRIFLLQQNTVVYLSSKLLLTGY